MTLNVKFSCTHAVSKCDSPDTTFITDNRETGPLLPNRPNQMPLYLNPATGIRCRIFKKKAW